ncbi:C-Maf-inducing protein isoform X4 [Nilaparvata lugens]|uniref:C-Maf-inducing protein isoform X3 n=1 Tax=Nilaparvata lugens TaxID=108931 RepID=UPI00193D8C2B|nr:C-Maf-inducing protein isoform X3 [Nilaparvata lugens]XP_039276542.1 C-Maf-inducing protein isoform X4 [Nilaparvata lugens]
MQTEEEETPADQDQEQICCCDCTSSSSSSSSSSEAGDPPNPLDPPDPLFESAPFDFPVEKGALNLIVKIEPIVETDSLVKSVSPDHLVKNVPPLESVVKNDNLEPLVENDNLEPSVENYPFVRNNSLEPFDPLDPLSKNNFLDPLPENTLLDKNDNVDSTEHLGHSPYSPDHLDYFFKNDPPDPINPISKNNLHPSDPLDPPNPSDSPITVFKNNLHSSDPLNPNHPDSLNPIFKNNLDPSDPSPPLNDPSVLVVTPATPDSPDMGGGKVPPPTPTPPHSPGARSGACPSPGPRFKLLTDGEVQCCYLHHTRTVVSKILASKFLRRWENHRLYLNDTHISSKTPSTCVSSLDYTRLEDVYVIGRWDAGPKFCVCLAVKDGSLLLQANNAYTRDQWYHSIMWKKNIFKYRNILKRSARSDVIVKEIKNLVDFVKSTPIQDECVSHVPIEIVSSVLEENSDSWCTEKGMSEEVLSAMLPLLENTPPTPQMCHVMSAHCTNHPRSPLIHAAFTPVIHRILKHNVDFSKFPHTRRLVQDYIYALHSHNDGVDVIRRFVASVHGPTSGCPHPRVLPNLISVCLAALFAEYEVPSMLQRRNLLSGSPDTKTDETELSSIVNCYLNVFHNVCEYDDWLPGLAQLLQPIPFPDTALASAAFVRRVSGVVSRVGRDARCSSHQCVLGVRHSKPGWFDLLCPQSIACVDEGQLWGQMLDTLINCCCKRKPFISDLVGKRLGACLLLALRDHDAAQTVLSLALEWQLIAEPDQRMTVVTALQSTAQGQVHYSMLCQRLDTINELQQKGGPRKLTLPSRSTDSDVIRLLSVGAFGNLECLSLAFTHVTSACAEHLIKLPALRYLNLWATKFGDAGLMMICEHLPKLQVLNLCETPVSDRGILALSSMSNLKKLNLNSTQLSAEAFETLKQKLPGLQEMDVRYTEAW